MVNVGIWRKTVGTTKIIVTIKTTEEESPDGTNLRGSATTVVGWGTRKQTVGRNFRIKKTEKFKKESSEEVGALFCGSVNSHQTENPKYEDWMGDTGATGHMTWDKGELTDVVETYVHVVVANGAK